MEINKVKYIHRVKTRTKKTGIVVHGTGGSTVEGAVSTFRSTGVSVPFIIDRYGKIYQLYDESFDHWHAGSHFREISKKTIGIELVCWNHLSVQNKKFVSWVGTAVPDSEVYYSKELWRGSKLFHTITAEQHKSLCWLLKMLCEKHGIKKSLTREYNPEKIKSIEWSGICFHSSFHPSKTDFHPDLIDKIYI